MLLPLLALIAQDPETAVDAERAFYRAAQTEGQWTAFRKFSTPDAVLFTPQPVKAHEWLPLKNPPIAVQWWPAESYVSCDGTVAVNTGPWVRPKGFGYFSTVWVRQGDGRFKWVYDGGDSLATPRALPEKPRLRTAACGGTPPALIVTPGDGNKSGGGESPDGTLVWIWRVTPDGARSFVVQLWNGTRFDAVIDDQIKAPPAS